MNLMATPSVGFPEAVKRGFNNLFNFNGRDRRSEYWWFVLCIAIVSVIDVFLIKMVFNIFEKSSSEFMAYFLTFVVLPLLSLLPAFLLLSVQVRRMHDRGKSGLLPVVSFASYALTVILFFLTVGISLKKNIDVDKDNPAVVAMAILIILYIILSCIIFVFALLDSEPRDNKYGPSKKYIPRNP